MASEALILPQDNSLTIKSMSQIFSESIKSLTGFLSGVVGKQEVALDADKKERAQNSIISKIRLNLFKVYDKYIIKGEFFKKTLAGLTVIGKRLADMAGNWFMKILGFLMIMSIIDPKGTMLKSIFGMISKIVVKIINKIIEYLPTLIEKMGVLINDVLPKLILAIVEPFKDLLGEDSVAYKFFSEVLPTAAPTLLKIFLAVGAFMKVWPIIVMIGKVLGVIGSIISFIWGMAQLIGFIFQVSIALVAGIAIAVIALGVLIYVYWDEIKAFFSWLGNKIMEIASSIGAFFSGLWDGIVDGVSSAIDSVFGFFSDFFKWYVGLYVKAWGAIINFGKKLIDWFKGLPSRIFSSMKDLGKWIGVLFTKLLDKITEFGNKLLSWVQTLWEGVKNSIGSIFSWLSDKVLDAINLIADIFTGIWNRITEGLSFVATSIFGIFSGIFKWLGDVVNLTWEGLNTFGKGLVNWFKGLPKRIFNSMRDLGKWLSKAFLKIIPESVVKKISWFMGKIGGIFSTIIDGLRNLAKSIKEGFYGIVDYMTAFGTDPWEFIRGGEEYRSGSVALQRYARESGLTNIATIRDAAALTPEQLDRHGFTSEMKSAVEQLKRIGVITKGKLDIKKAGEKEVLVKVQQSTEKVIIANQLKNNAGSQ
jgi:phage-related protein